MNGASFMIFDEDNNNTNEQTLSLLDGIEWIENF